MVSQGELFQGCIVVVDKSEPQVVLVSTIIIGTALPEMFTEASASVPLFVRVVARRAVLGEPSYRGYCTPTVHFPARHILDGVNVPTDFVIWCPIMGQVAVHLEFSLEKVRLDKCRLLHMTTEGTFSTSSVFSAVPRPPLQCWLLRSASWLHSSSRLVRSW